MSAQPSPFLLLPNDIPSMETRLSDAGVSVEQFCADVGINRSTWTRWKGHGVSPSLDIWHRVVTEFARRTETRIEGAA